MIIITPLNDLKEHIIGSVCSCCPKVSIENGEIIITHRSFDNREIIEDLCEEQGILVSEGHDGWRVDIYPSSTSTFDL